MKGLTRDIAVALATSCLMNGLQAILHSRYLTEFLSNNLVSLLVALLAINTASLSIVLSKIREIADSCGKHASFTKTRREILFSIKEQVLLVGLSLLLLTVYDSQYLDGRCVAASFVLEILIASCFVYALLILYDTAHSIFVILGEDNG